MQKLSALGVGANSHMAAPASYGAPSMPRQVPRQEWQQVPAPYPYAPAQHAYAAQQATPMPFNAGNMPYPSRTGTMPKYPHHEACGRIHPPDAPCYGRDFDPRVHMRAPPAQPRMPPPAAPQPRQVHVTRLATQASETPGPAPSGDNFSFATPAPTAEATQPVWPPLHALMTVRADAGASKPKVCAATPVPFRVEVPNRASVPGAAPAPVPKPAPPPMATVRVLGSQLSQQDMAAMQKLPGFEVSFQVPMPTLLGALQRTDLLPQSQTHVAAATHAETPRAHIQEVHATQSIASHAHEQTTTHENPALPGPSLFGHEKASVRAATKHAPELELPAFDVAKYLEAESGL